MEITVQIQLRAYRRSPAITNLLHKITLYYIVFHFTLTLLNLKYLPICLFACRSGSKEIDGVSFQILHSTNEYNAQMHTTNQPIRP